MLFATRSSISKLYFIEQDQPPRPLSQPADITNDMLTDLLGARVQVRRQSAPPIFCEDEWHMSLLTDVVRDLDAAPVMVSSCEAVIAAVNSDASMKSIMVGVVAKCGVVDRDFFSQSHVDGLEAKNVFCLPYNEAECVVLQPALMTPYLTDVSAGKITDTEYLDLFFEAARHTLDAS